MSPKQKVAIAVHKFSSCDGCQLGFLNAVDAVLQLEDWLEIRHFAEAGPFDPQASVDIAFVEGSISTTEDMQRIRQVRSNCRLLVSIGACATSGGIQALRNMASHKDWLAAVYASPEFIDSLDTTTPISEHVVVDHELWGCPIDGYQLLTGIQSWLLGGTPQKEVDSVCAECKRNQNSCVLVTRKKPCLGPVTRGGCGAICPSLNRECYGCFGPSSEGNTQALAKQFSALNKDDKTIADAFLQINSQAEAFNEIGLRYRNSHD